MSQSTSELLEQPLADLRTQPRVAEAPLCHGRIERCKVVCWTLPVPPCLRLPDRGPWARKESTAFYRQVLIRVSEARNARNYFRTAGDCPFHQHGAFIYNGSLTIRRGGGGGSNLSSCYPWTCRFHPLLKKSIFIPSQLWSFYDIGMTNVRGW